MYEIPWWKIKLEKSHIEAFQRYLSVYRATSGFNQVPVTKIALDAELKLIEELGEIELQRLLKKENKKNYKKIEN